MWRCFAWNHLFQCSVHLKYYLLIKNVEEITYMCNTYKLFVIEILSPSLFTVLLKTRHTYLQMYITTSASQNIPNNTSQAESLGLLEKDALHWDLLWGSVYLHILWKFLLAPFGREMSFSLCSAKEKLPSPLNMHLTQMLDILWVWL